MSENYKALRIISIAFKVLAVLVFLGTNLITVLNFMQGPPGGPNQHMAFNIFNLLFPIFIGLFKTLFLYALGELIILFIEVKSDLAKINHSLRK
ncbi:hypothetical protein MWH28_07955 [Natroniella sulfidigena]|uniref:hypothetical protein n=1 Tax=Natroniella sulfidigena TaxID=723921 RepID=UPI002009F16D|nr:hypothetical protein [Natroniella sulfidigena]MCK8817294.1 hypothetical protein [Natroniella sulfidigena]